MRRIDEFVARRRALADRYDLLLADLPVIRAPRDTNANSAWHLYVIQIDQQRTNKSRKEAFDAMRRAQILVNVHYIPVHLQPYYRRFGFAPGDYPAAEAYYDNAISLPMYAAMSDEQQDRVVTALKDALA
jgi:dTDP-4-amino-4,6-dideoxygalactose transaminase